MRADPDPALAVRRLDGPGEPPILLLHGFTGSVAAWGSVILEALSRRRTVLAVDLPGHGDSPAPSAPEGYRWERTLEAVLAALDAHGAEAADWVGYSMGARLALAAAVEHPDRVRRLVLESGSPGLETAASRERRRRSDAALARRIESRGMEWFVDHWMSLFLFATQRRLPAELRAAERERRLANTPEVLGRTLRGMGTGSQPSYWLRLREVRTPTLLLTGALDRKYEAVARQMEGALPRARRRSVPGVGHAVHLEAPDRWLEAVRPFLLER